MARINPLSINNISSVDELVRWGSIFFDSVVSILSDKISIVDNIKSQVFRGDAETSLGTAYGITMLRIRHDLRSKPVLVLPLVDEKAPSQISEIDVRIQLGQQRFWDENFVYVNANLEGKKPYFILVA